MKILLLTTSYPRDENDDAGIFVKRLAEALAKKIDSLEIVVPHDNKELLIEQHNNITTNRYKYGIFSRGKLAFGAGILPNLKNNPLLLLQVPGLLLGMFFTGYKACSNKPAGDLYIIANWIINAIPAFLLSKVFKQPFFLIVRGQDIKLIKVPLLKTFLKFFLKQS